METDDSSIEIWGDNRKVIEDKIGTIMSDFRKGLKYEYKYNVALNSFVFKTPFENKEFRVPKDPYSYLLHFDKPKNHREELFIKMLIRRLEKSMAKYGVSFTKQKDEEKQFKSEHELIGKEVVVRDWDRGKIVFRGITVGYDGSWKFRVQSKYQDKYMIADHRRVELLTPNMDNASIDDSDRINKAVRQLKKYSSDWEFLKANRIKEYLDRIGYKR